MQLPVLNEYNQFKDNTENFLGYNHQLKTKKGEWFDQYNMTSDYFPVASTRNKRGKQLDIVPINYPSEVGKADLHTDKVLGMLYSDNKLVTLREVKDRLGNNIGACFVENEQIVNTKVEKKLFQFTANASNSKAGLTINNFTDFETLRDDNPSAGRLFNQVDCYRGGNVPGWYASYKQVDGVNSEIYYYSNRLKLWGRDWKSSNPDLKKEKFDGAPPLEGPSRIFNHGEYVSPGEVDKSLRITGAEYTKFRLKLSVADVSKLETKKQVQLRSGNSVVGSFDIASIQDSDNVNFKYVFLAPLSGVSQTSEQPLIGTFDMYLVGGDNNIRDSITRFDGTVDYKRSVIKNGAYTVVFPDGVAYKKGDTNQIEKINKEVTIKPTIGLQFVTAVKNNETYDNINSKDYRLVDNKVQQFLKDQNTWVDVKTYVIISGKGTPAHTVDPSAQTGLSEFRKGNVVNLVVNNPTNVSGDKVNGILSYNQSKQIYEANNKRIVSAGAWNGDDTGPNRYAIVVEGYIESNGSFNYTSKDETKISRKCPKIKFACESNNRIWGCSQDGHEIYASALGDPYNYYDFSGISTDSYAVNVGTEGEFTGCINYLGNPLFFKENCLHYVTGSFPAQYSVTPYNQFKGVQKGCERSLAIINNILYYKSSLGIVAFDGANTQLVSYELGDKRYTDAVAGVYEDKYIVSMKNAQGEYEMFSYDTKKGLWSKEDNTKAEQFINVDSEVIYLDDNKQQIYSTRNADVLKNGQYQSEGDINWLVDTGNFGYSLPNKKYISRYQFRMKLEAKAKATFYIQYNGDGVWHRKGEMSAKGTRSYLMPIIPMRCDHMRVKVEGTGNVKIFSITKILEEGGDI